jgi:ABC-type glutathione transport system ATPase component
VFYAFPVYDLDYGILAINNRNIIAQVTQEPEKDPLDPDVAGTGLYFLIGEVFVYWILIALIENKVFDQLYKTICCKGQRGSRQRNEQEEFRASMLNGLDEDVQAEAERVKNINDLQDTPVKCDALRKSYDGKVAVNSLSFGLEYGECFALLGVSGAGKSTTFKCLTGEIDPDEGQLFIKEYNIQSPLDYSKARKSIGYCP